MKCLDCNKGYYIEKKIKQRNKRFGCFADGSYRTVTIEVCNKCGCDFSWKSATSVKKMNVKNCWIFIV